MNKKKLKKNEIKAGKRNNKKAKKYTIQKKPKKIYIYILLLLNKQQNKRDKKIKQLFVKVRSFDWPISSLLVTTK